MLGTQSVTEVAMQLPDLVVQLRDDSRWKIPGGIDNPINSHGDNPYSVAPAPSSPQLPTLNAA